MWSVVDVRPIGGRRVKDVVCRGGRNGSIGIYRVELVWYNDYHKRMERELIADIVAGNLKDGWTLCRLEVEHGIIAFPRIDGFVSRQAAITHRLKELKIYSED
jgi:hypothetical protein